MGCSPTHVWFSVTDPNKPEENLLVNTGIPFLFIGQLLFSQKLIIMPHESFHKLAQELGDPNDRTITFVGMSGVKYYMLIITVLRNINITYMYFRKMWINSSMSNGCKVAKLQGP